MCRSYNTSVGLIMAGVRASERGGRADGREGGRAAGPAAESSCRNNWSITTDGIGGSVVSRRSRLAGTFTSFAGDAPMSANIRV